MEVGQASSRLAPAASPPSLTKSCVCYVINNGYLLPALVSAVQAREHTPAQTTDVIILCVDQRIDAGKRVAGIAAQHGVKLLQFDPDVTDRMHIMFGRLFLHRMLPEHYRRIVYIDGDTQVAGSLGPLAEAEIPPGGFLACRDPAALFAQLSSGWRQRVKAEREKIGYGRPFADYLNSGVLVLDRQSWPALSEACLEMVGARGRSLKYPDQDIINLAIGDRCLLIPNRWNFPGFLIGSEAESLARPVIYHFMSNPRPWVEAVQPWGKAWARPYADLLEMHPELSNLACAPSPMRTMRYWLQQELKMMLEYRSVGRFLEPAPHLSI